MTLTAAQKKWIDHDLTPPPGFKKGLLTLDDDGLFARTKDIPYLADAFPELMIPRSEHKARAAKLWPKQRASVTQIYSQGSEGSCVGFGSAQMLETTLRRRYGKRHWVSLSGMSVYKRIGNSPNSGANIPDGLDAVVEGVLPVDSPENKAKYQHTHPRTGFRTPLPSGWQETAKLFRATKVARCEGYDMNATAMLLNVCGIVGRNGHCIPYVGLTFNGNSALFPYANSWDTDWGDEGFGYDSERTGGNLTLYIVLEVGIRPDLGVPIL